MKRTVWRVAVLLSATALLSAQSKEWRGTWTATAGGRTLGGSWSAALGDDVNVAFGSWTLLDTAGKQIASGTWSVRKGEKRWDGTWQARDARNQTFSGSWTARSPIISPSRLSDLLDLALSNVVSGTWQAGRSNGGWSIRAFPRE